MGLDRLRLEYRKTAVSPSGKQVVVRARRKVNDDAISPLDTSPLLPVVVVATWAAIREFRLRRKYQGLWIVEVYPRFQPERAQVVAEALKYEAFDLVDAKAAELGPSAD